MVSIVSQYDFFLLWHQCHRYIPLLKDTNFYNQAIIYKCQNFLKVVVHVIIIDQLYQALDEIQVHVTVIYSHAILVAVMFECCC